MIKGLVGAIALSAAFVAQAGGSVESIIDQAIAANKEAKTLGYEWNVTGKAIKAAQAALKAGDSAEAMKLAAHAKYMAEASVYQGNDEANMWQMRVPK